MQHAVARWEISRGVSTSTLVASCFEARKNALKFQITRGTSVICLGCYFQGAFAQQANEYRTLFSDNYAIHEVSVQNSVNGMAQE
jgi:hypothetical protein